MLSPSQQVGFTFPYQRCSTAQYSAVPDNNKILMPLSSARFPQSERQDQRNLREIAIRMNLLRIGPVRKRSFFQPIQYQSGLEKGGEERMHRAMKIHLLTHKTIPFTSVELRHENYSKTRRDSRKQTCGTGCWWSASP